MRPESESLPTHTRVSLACPQSKSDWDQAQLHIVNNDAQALSRLITLNPALALQVNRMGETLLSCAAQAPHSDCAFVLLPHSQPERLDFVGCGALTHAVTTEHEALVEALLNALSHEQLQAQVDLEGWSPLTFAVYTRQLRMVDLLLARGMDPTLINESGDSLLTLLTGGGPTGHERVQLLDRLLPLCDANVITPQGWNALMLAVVVLNDFEVIQRLLAHTRPGQKNERDTWILKYAVNRKDERLVHLFAPLESAVQDAQGRTALMLAALDGDKKMVRLLLPHSDARTRDEQGCSALLLAYTHNKWNSLDALCLASDPIEAACVFESVGAQHMPSWAAAIERAALDKALRERSSSEYLQASEEVTISGRRLLPRRL